MTMEKTKVAIITRTKDRPVFLARALESVASQTYEDYIHVVVNDGGSKDEVEEVVAHSSRKQSVLVFHREIASGAPDTIFNESIDRVDSDYIAIHDDDDTWHPQFLARTVKVLDDGASGVVVRTNKVVETVDGSTLRTLKTTAYMPDILAVSLYRQCIDNQLTPIAFAYRRSAYEHVGKYNSTLPVVGDWEFGLRFLQQYDVEYLDPGFALANYHHRKASGDNSFAKHNHRKYFTQVANMYLRAEISDGKLGVGYIISKLKYDQDIRHGIVKQILPASIIRRLKK